MVTVLSGRWPPTVRCRSFAAGWRQACAELHTGRPQLSRLRVRVVEAFIRSGSSPDHSRRMKRFRQCLIEVSLRLDKDRSYPIPPTNENRGINAFRI